MYTTSVEKGKRPGGLIYIVSGRALQSELLQHCLDTYPALADATYAYSATEKDNGDTEIRVVSTRI